MQTIIITGGHHNSALVVAKELIKKGFHVVWLGHQFASKGDVHDSAEYLEVKWAGIPFHELKAGKLDSTPTFSEIINIPLGFIRGWSYLRKFKPAAVLSFGGYLGLAASVPAYLLGIPVFLHEQTIIAGRANIITGKFAKRIYLSWDKSAKYFPLGNTKLVGLPLRPSITSSKPKNIFDNDLPTILVIGGKLGSHVINKHIFLGLPALLLRYNVIHQTGMSSVTGDYEAAVAKKNSLPPDLAAHYLPTSYIGEEEIGTYMATANLVVGRSGAHTAYELAVLGKQSVLIPFMHTTGSEQYQQAKLLEAEGLAIILPEGQLTTPSLIQTIKLALSKSSVKPLSLPKNAADLLIEDLVKSIS